MKKDSERLFLDALIELRPDLRITDPSESESPDFICIVSGIRTGIELTQFHFPSASNRPPQAMDAYRSQFNSLLEELHQFGNHPPVYVSIFLHSEEWLMLTSDRRMLAERILSFVVAHTPPLGPPVEYRMDGEATELLSMGVDRIMIISDPGLIAGTYAVGDAAFVPESRSHLIQDILDKKADRIQDYRRQAPKIWLLIVSGTGGGHSIIDYNSDVLTAEYSTAFDRIFLFRTFGSLIHELKRADHE